MGFIGKFQQAVGNVAVWYLRQKNLGTFLESVGLILDGAADGMLAGMRLGYPLRCPADQLPVIAKDRGITLYPTEPEESQRQRLRQWWWLHKFRGSHQGEMRHAMPYFLPNLPTIRIVHQSGDGGSATWHTLLPTSNPPGSVFPFGRYTRDEPVASNFNYDGQASKWARWWVFIDMSSTGYPAPHTYDSGGAYDTSGWIYDALGTQALADISAMFNDWKAAHSWLGGVILWWPMVGGAPFPSSAGVPTQDPSGWWSLPNGPNTWSVLVDPATNKPTRPPNMTWAFDNPAP